ncbi:hypothetical protein HY625_01155 [Candidatus Uhrbacteria bacterium]|nr:hypothetical protein [Candidatus Uhrbacteria bacterium]
MLQYLVFVGGAVNIYASVRYIKDVIRGDTKPNRVSWLMWSIAPLIATAAAFSNGVRWAVLPIFLSGFTPLMTFVASFANPNAYWKLEKFDYLCGFFSLLALALWGFTQAAVVAIIFAIVSDCLAAVPTLIKSWKYPATESGSTYWGGLVSALTGFFAIQTWIFSAYAFLISIMVQNSLILFAIYRRRFIKT